MSMEGETQVTGQVAEVEAPEANTADVETDGQDTSTDEGGDDAPGADVDGELKTVRKALDKRNRYINNQRNKIRTLEAEIQKMQKAFGENKSTAPELEKFESVIDYVKADSAFTLDQKLAEQAHKNEIAQLERLKQAERAQQDQAIASELDQIIRSTPDAQKVFKDNKAVIEAMPDAINELFYEIDDPSAAIYALAKEGRLGALYSMSPHIAAAHLVQAEIRGQQYLQQAAPKAQAQQTQAPKPIGSLKGGGGSSTKSIPQLKGEKLLNWIES